MLPASVWQHPSPCPSAATALSAVHLLHGLLQSLAVASGMMAPARLFAIQQQPGGAELNACVPAELGSAQQWDGSSHPLPPSSRLLVLTIISVCLQSLAVASGLVAAALSLPSSNSQVAVCMLKTMAANLTMNTTTMQLTNISCPSIVTIFGLAFNVADQLSNQDLFTTVLTISSNEVRQNVSTDAIQLNGIDKLLNCTGLLAPVSTQTLISTQAVSTALLWDAGNATAPLT